MLRFALKTLAHDRGKLLMALLGVVFSLVLVSIQGGLFLGLMGKSSILVENSNADIWITHPGTRSADLPAQIPEAWIARIRGLPGVARAVPYIVASAPYSVESGTHEVAWIVGSDLEAPLGGGWNFVEGTRNDLLRTNAISIDQLDANRLGNPGVGDFVEINNRRARVAAKTRGIQGFTNSPHVFTSIDNARRFAQMPLTSCTFFLVEAEADADLDQLCDRIRRRVPELEVYTSAEFSHKSQVYWATRSGIGLSFGGATVLGLLVGLVMVGQSLYALALDHLDEYATLKAMGAESRYICGILLMQGAALAVTGCTLGCVIAVTIERFASIPQAPITIPVWLLATGAVLATTICLLSSVLPYRRIRNVDPATVLRG